ncbi:MAG: helix-turn-helix domain-containing protein [Pirellulales bacterium]
MKTDLPPSEVSRVLLSAKTIADMMDVNERTIWRWVSAGKIIPPLRIGDGTTRWQRQKIDEWIAAGCPKPDFD